MKGRFVLGLTLAAVLAVSACSKEDSATDPSPVDQGSATMLEGPVVYGAADFSFDGPDTLPAGTSDITMDNVGANEHELIIVELAKNQDWTDEEFVQFVKDNPQAQPKWATVIAGTKEPSAPGDSGSVQFVDMSGEGQPEVMPDASLEPGTYLLMCFVGDKGPHAGMGMVKKITVS